MVQSISPPFRPHYPWLQGEELVAEELNAAIANAGHGMRVTDWIPGGQPDGVTDLSLYFQEAIDAAADADPTNRAAAPGLTRFIVPANPIPYMLGSTLYIPSNSHIIIEVGATLKAMPTRGVVPVPAQYGGTLQIGVSGGGVIENVIIELYGTLDGDWLNQAGDIGGREGTDPIVGAGVQGAIVGNPCNNVHVTGKGLGTITRYKNFPCNLSHCSNSEINGINISYCGNSFGFAGLTSRVNVIPDPASHYTAATGIISFKCDAPHGINVGDIFSFTAAVAPSQFLQAEYVAKTVPDDRTVTSVVPVPTVGTGPITSGHIGSASGGSCYNVHIVDCLVEHISDLAIVLYSGCHNSSIRGCEVRYCTSSGPTIFCDGGQPASCSDCEVSGCYVHDNQGGGTGITSNQPGIVHRNCRVFNNVVHDNIFGGLVAGSCDGLEVFGNSVHNVTALTSIPRQTCSLYIPSTTDRANVWGNTIRDQGKPLISSTITVGVLVSYDPLTGNVGLNTLAPATGLSLGVLAPHNINPGDQFNLANAYGTDDCLHLEGWQTATAGTTGSTLNFTVTPGLVFTLRRITVRQFTYAVPVSHLVAGTYTSDASGIINLTTDIPHGYPPGWPFVLANIVGGPPGTGGATDFAPVVLNGQWVTTATVTSATTLNFVTKPNVTLVITDGRVHPGAFGIALDITGSRSDYLRLADNRVGDHQKPLNMTAALGGVWGLHSVSSGNYFGPRAAVDADVSDYSLGSINGPNHDLVSNALVANHTVSGFVNFSGSDQRSVGPSIYLPAQGLTPGWNRSGGIGEVNFYVGRGQGGGGGFNFLQTAIIRISFGGPSTYDPATGIVSLTTTLPHTVIPGGTFLLNYVKGTDTNDGDDIARLNGGHTANSDTNGSTLTFTAQLNLTVASITDGTVFPTGVAGSGLLDTGAGQAGTLFSVDYHGNAVVAGRLTLGVLPANAANDAAAAAAGVTVGGVYRNGSILMVRVI